MRAVSSHKIRRQDTPPTSFHSSVSWYGDLKRNLDEEYVERVRGGIKRKAKQFKGAVQYMNKVVHCYLNGGGVYDLIDIVYDCSRDSVLMTLMFWVLVNEWSIRQRMTLYLTLQAMMEWKNRRERFSKMDIESAVDALYVLCNDAHRLRLDVMRREMRVRGLLPFRFNRVHLAIVIVLLLSAMMVAFKFSTFSVKS